MKPIHYIHIHIDERYIEYAWHAVSGVNVWHTLVSYVAGLNSAAFNVPEFQPQSRRDRSTRGLRPFDILTYIYSPYMYIPTYVCVRACDVRLAGCIALFFCFLSSLSLFLFGGRTEGAYKFLLVRVCVSFYFGFLSLVVRTAELDGGCMRLSRDHMWVLSPLILIPLCIYLCFHRNSIADFLIFSFSFAFHVKCFCTI